jgi:small GTP-binding protein
MSRWRIVVVLVLLVGPILAFAAVGGFFLWREGIGFLVWLPLAASMVAGYVLAWYWQRTKQLLRPVEFPEPGYWTERDRQAWKLVQARSEAAAKLPPDQLITFQFYVDTARDMAQELARFYHPKMKDPIGPLTIPEILAAVELAAQDLSAMVETYLPAGHLLTIDNWRRAKQISDWYQTASNIYWLISAVFAPVETGVRYATTRMGMSRPWQLLQENLIAWFATAYVHYLGTYLVDLNSGRLRVGAKRYRELLRQWNTERGEGSAPPAAPDGQATPVTTPSPADSADQVREISLTIIGQVKAGKSSFINALLGEQRALTDVLPATDEVTVYQLQPAGIPTRLRLFDTVGYGHTGPRADQLRATAEAARQSDLIILVLHARNPARQADLEMVKELRAWFLSKPDLRMPPILGVMTHIDLLSPALEWAPPYNWVEPQRPKEHQIQQARNALKDQLGEYLVGIVPLCTAPGKVYGLDEWLWPTLVELLDEAHAVALLRCIRAEANLGKVRKVFRQFLEAGTLAVKVLWHFSRK